MEKLNEYRKTITAVVTGAIGWATLVIVSDPVAITAPEWVAGATALAIALGVYAVPNDPPVN
jgi:predicted RecA/RadA family phage recombinase